VGAAEGNEHRGPQDGEDLMPSHGRWKGPCVQTTPMRPADALSVEDIEYLLPSYLESKESRCRKTFLI
jgi:hypothetical protein